jgi:hypothetical protein
MKLPDGSHGYIVTGIGNIKSLKNNKFIAQGRMITQPEAWKQAKKIVNDLESQLLSDLGIEDATTWMAQSEQFSTVSSGLVEEFLTELPSDDNYTVVSELEAHGFLVPKGKEFIAIHIERI